MKQKYSRKRIAKKLGDSYKIMPGFFRHNRCWYCGDKKELFDHCPPMSWVWSKGTDYCYKNNIPLWLVPSCRECNGLLGNRAIRYVDDRVYFLYERYQKKYMEILENPAWDADELDELGPNLRGFVENTETIRKWVDRKLSYMDEVHDLLIIQALDRKKRENGLQAI